MEKTAQLCTGHDYSKPGKPKIDWADPAAKDVLVSALVNDANAVVQAFKDAGLEEAPTPARRATQPLTAVTRSWPAADAA
jgi:hypothetical protein